MNADAVTKPCWPQVFLSGRRPFFYTFDLATAQTHRVAQLQGKPKEKSLESMWMCPDDKHVVFGGHNGCLMLVDRKVGAGDMADNAAGADGRVHAEQALGSRPQDEWQCAQRGV